MRKIYPISVIDPNSLSTEGLRHVLNRRTFEIVEHWDDIEQAIEMAPPESRRDAILINLAGHELPPQRSMDRLREAFPGARIALIGESCDPDRIRQAVNIELDGFLLESISIEAFAKAVELIILGVQVLPVQHQELNAGADQPAIRKPDIAALEGLTSSEMRVLALIAMAWPNKVIARELGISESTVKVHVKAILRKTGSQNRTDAALLVHDANAKDYLDEVALNLTECERRKRGDSPAINGKLPIPNLHLM